MYGNAGLAGERSRWEVSIVSLEAQLQALPGDVALASAFMSYAGPFPSQYREDLAKHTWQKQVGLLCTLCTHSPPCPLQYSLVNKPNADHDCCCKRC